VDTTLGKLLDAPNLDPWLWASTPNLPHSIYYTATQHTHIFTIVKLGRTETEVGRISAKLEFMERHNTSKIPGLITKHTAT